jgi:hypothetical protein
VGIPAGNARQQAGREMEIDGKDICPKSLKGFLKNIQYSMLNIQCQ